MNGGAETLLSGVSGELNAVPPAAERAERFVAIVTAMNDTVRREADQHLTLDSDPRSLEALFAGSAGPSR
jgi:hypothetical protein